MPIVPFTAPPKTPSGKPLPDPPAEPFALMAAAQMHAENRLIVPESKMEPSEREGWSNSWSDAMEDTPKNRAKVPEGYEGMATDSGMLFIRPLKQPQQAVEALTS